MAIEKISLDATASLVIRERFIAANAEEKVSNRRRNSERSDGKVRTRKPRRNAERGR